MINQIRRLYQEFPIYLGNLNSPNVSCFVIFAQGRTGTWLLHNMLNQHPHIHCDKEILEGNLYFPLYYTLGKSRQTNKPVYGCHIQINQLLNTHNIDPKKFIHRLYSHGWGIIYLRRQDIIRQSISAILAVQRQEWVTYKMSGIEKETIIIDIDKVIQRIQRRIKHLQQETEILQEIPHLPLVYEIHLQCADKHQNTMNSIFTFLEQESVEITPETKKILPEKLEEVIVNYSDLMRCIRQTFPDLS